MRSLLFVLVLFVSLPVQAQASGEGTPSEFSASFESGDARYEVLLDYAVTFAKKMLAKQESFLPFGVTLTTDSTFLPVQLMYEEVGPDMALATALALREMVENGVKLEGRERTELAVAGVCIDILTSVPGRPGKTDAISVLLERPGHSARAYILPYTREGERITYLRPYYREEPGFVFVGASR